MAQWERVFLDYLGFYVWLKISFSVSPPKQYSWCFSPLYPLPTVASDPNSRLEPWPRLLQYPSNWFFTSDVHPLFNIFSWLQLSLLVCSSLPLLSCILNSNLVGLLAFPSPADIQFSLCQNPTLLLKTKTIHPACTVWLSLCLDHIIPFIRVLRVCVPYFPWNSVRFFPHISSCILSIFLLILKRSSFCPPWFFLSPESLFHLTNK